MTSNEDFQKHYEDMKRLAVFLLLKQGGEVTITEREIMDTRFLGQAIEYSMPHVGSGDYRVRVVPDPAFEESP
jgi:hypothetical protein